MIATCYLAAFGWLFDGIVVNMLMVSNRKTPNRPVDFAGTVLLKRRGSERRVCGIERSEAEPATG
jgi:hypothetical protein